jgi:hypothetical protein
VQFVWPDTPIRRSARLADSVGADALFASGMSMSPSTSTPMVHHMPPAQEDAAAYDNNVDVPAVPLAATYHDLPIDDVHLPTVELPPEPANEDWLTAAIGDADPMFMDSQDHSDSGRPSSCDDMQEYESDDDDTNFFDTTQNLEDLLWPPELLHHAGGLARPLPRHQRRVRRPNPGERKERAEDYDNAQTGIGDVGRSPERAARVGAAMGLPARTGNAEGSGASPTGSGPAQGATGSPGGSGDAHSMEGGWPSPRQTFGQGWVQGTGGDRPEEGDYYQEGGLGIHVQDIFRPVQQAGLPELPQTEMQGSKWHQIGLR